MNKQSIIAALSIIASGCAAIPPGRAMLRHEGSGAAVYRVVGDQTEGEARARDLMTCYCANFHEVNREYVQTGTRLSGSVIVAKYALDVTYKCQENP